MEHIYQSKEESTFKAHALENHPKSNEFFKPAAVQSKINSAYILNVFYCCPECDYKSKDLSMFQIHALKEHPITSLPFFTRDSKINLKSKQSNLNNSLLESKVGVSQN